MKMLLPLLLCVVLAGCATTGVIPMDKDTYMIAKRSAQLGFGAPIGAKADVYREANDFCSKQNKKVETVECKEQNSGFGRPASVSLQFRCVIDSASK